MEVQAIFKSYSLGVSTNRDAIVYDFDKEQLLKRIEVFIEDYNAEVDRYIRKGKPEELDDFLDYENLQWSETLKRKLRSGQRAAFDRANVIEVVYRPFTKRFLYSDPILNDRPGLLARYFPTPKSNTENQAISVTNHTQIPFLCQMLSSVASLDVGGRPGQIFPFYTYTTDGSKRRENITNWALQVFKSHYSDSSITKWQIFHYVYAVLHHPAYREQYAADLKRELPRIPFTSEFHSAAEIGSRLAEIHDEYEMQVSYPLERIEKPKHQLDWRVEKMKLTKDKRTLVYNSFLTVGEIPQEAFEYRLGNRSALDWIIDQYQMRLDKRSGISSDPNRPDDPEYIVRLIGQIITVSLETVKLMKKLGSLPLTSVDTI